MKVSTHKRLGDILIESKAITPQNLAQALEIQKKKGGLIGQILVALGATTEQAIALGLTSQSSLPYLPLAAYRVNVEMAQLLPQETARRLEAVVIDQIGKVITVAMSDPLNEEGIQEIEKKTGCRRLPRWVT